MLSKRAVLKITVVLFFLLKLFSFYSRICLIRLRLFGQFAQFVTFSSVPAKFLSFTCIPDRLIRHRLIRHRLIRHFAEFVTYLNPRETFCLSYSSFAYSIQFKTSGHSFCFVAQQCLHVLARMCARLDVRASTYCTHYYTFFYELAILVTPTLCIVLFFGYCVICVLCKCIVFNNRRNKLR